LPTNSYRVARCKYDEKLVFVGQRKNMVVNSSSKDYARHVLPRRKPLCEFCKSLMWIDEKIKKSTFKSPKFGQCCLHGTVDIPPLKQLPKEIYNLITLESNYGIALRLAIRLYNSILAFASTSANVDQALMAATVGVYTYRIQGAVHHAISSYLPKQNQRPQFSQIYTYDADMQSTIRTGMYPKAIIADILNIFQHQLHLNNPYVRIYMQVGELLRNEPGKELNIVLKANDKYDRTKNKPTFDEIAVIINENEEATVNSRDIVVRKRNPESDSDLLNINENLHMYDALAFPLMHIYGESGWQFNYYPKRTKDHLIEQYNMNNNIPTNQQQNHENDEPLDYHYDFYDFLDVDLDDIEIDLNLDLEGGQAKTKNSYVSAREFYSYRFHDKEGKFFII
jgi:hypothetical protein